MSYVNEGTERSGYMDKSSCRSSKVLWYNCYYLSFRHKKKLKTFHNTQCTIYTYLPMNLPLNLCNYKSTTRVLKIYSNFQRCHQQGVPWSFLHQCFSDTCFNNYYLSLAKELIRSKANWCLEFKMSTEWVKHVHLLNTALYLIIRVKNILSALFSLHYSIVWFPCWYKDDAHTKPRRIAVGIGYTVNDFVVSLGLLHFCLVMQYWKIHLYRNNRHNSNVDETQCKLALQVSQDEYKKLPVPAFRLLLMSMTVCKFRTY